MMASAVENDLTIPGPLWELVTRKAGDLNMLPAVATQAVEIANDPNCSIERFTAVINRDAKLAADILKLANSAAYSPGTPILNLNQAVVRLGFRQCKNLILSSSMTALMKKMTLDQEWVREILSRHAFVTAMLGVHVNKALAAGFQGEEFTGGLMHDFGRLLFAVTFGEQFAQLDPLEFEESPETLDRERQLAGTDHGSLGAWFAQGNRLPASLVEVVRYHHQPELAQDSPRLVALVAACDHMANHIQRTDGADGYDPEANEGVRTLERSGVRNAAARFREVHGRIMEIAQTDALAMLSF